MVNIVVKSPDLQPYMVDMAPVILTVGHMVAVGEQVHNGDLPKHPDTDGVMGDYRDKVPEHAYITVLGFVNTTLTLWAEGHALVQWRHPEDGLHPKHQCEMADVIVRLHQWQEAHHPTTKQAKADLMKAIEAALRVHATKR